MSKYDGNKTPKCETHRQRLTLSFILFTLLFFLLSFAEANATVRYVSKTGNSTPPFLTWETAADSIQKCINISVFGDTIYVANGVYQEQVVMIPGLALIGSGMDSCIIDTRALVQPIGFFAVATADSSYINGFRIVVSNTLENGGGIIAANDSSDSTFYSNISFNKIENAHWGILINNTISVAYDNFTIANNNFLNNMFYGIFLNNSSSIISNNQMINITSRGIYIEAITYSYKPLIENNIISTSNVGINEGIGTKPTIRNNVIFLNDDFARGIWCGLPDTLWIYNNLIISESLNYVGGLINSQLPIFEYNNFLIGIFENGAISGGEYNLIYNNNIMNGSLGIDQRVGNPVIKYNNSWNNEVNYGGFTPDSTNLSVDPMIVNGDTTQGDLDFHLQMFSPLINAGDPNILDKDNTRSDIGLYGGPYGESYIYIDLPPRPPRNLSVEVDSLIKLRWNKNTESDFSYYNVYRDTTFDFTVDSTKLIASVTDTLYYQTLPSNVETLYYKLSAVDNQGNESNPSEQVSVKLVSVKNEWIPVNNYILYQNYPNPFNPSTKIGYKLKEGGYVKLYVYDIKGELVSVLVNQTQEAGYYEVEFNAEVKGQMSNVKGQLASGIYIYQIFVKGENGIPVFSDIKKMVYVK